MLNHCLHLVVLAGFFFCFRQRRFFFFCVIVIFEAPYWLKGHWKRNTAANALLLGKALASILLQPCLRLAVETLSSFELLSLFDSSCFATVVLWGEVWRNFIFFFTCGCVRWSCSPFFFCCCWFLSHRFLYTAPLLLSSSYPVVTAIFCFLSIHVLVHFFFFNLFMHIAAGFGGSFLHGRCWQFCSFFFFLLLAPSLLFSIYIFFFLSVVEFYTPFWGPSHKRGKRKNTPWTRKRKQQQQKC